LGLSQYAPQPSRDREAEWAVRNAGQSILAASLFRQGSHSGCGSGAEGCASRELKEETGYSAGHLRQLTTIYTTPGFTDERIHIFVGDALSQGEAFQEPDEFLELHSVPLSEAVAMVRSGKIVDGKTVIGLLLAACRE
jgi:8-oxo-dGTP pyrophosphatase MutT (NUDIX family)